MFTKVGGKLVGVNPMFGPDGGAGGAGSAGGAAAGGEIKQLVGQINTEIKNIETQLIKRLDEQQQQINQKGTTDDKTVNQIKELEGKLDLFQKDLNELVVKSNRGGGQGGAQERKTAGELFTGSDAYKAALQSNPSAPQTGLVDVKGFFPSGRKELTSGANSGGELVIADRMPGIVTDPMQRMTIRNLLNTRPTTSNAIEYVEMTGFTNNAAPRAEGALAAESNLTFATKQTAVKTISHYVVATNNILADAGELQNVIDTQLLYGLQLEEESQILYGDGLGENLTGLMVQSGVQDLGYRGTVKNYIEHLRTAFTKVRLAEMAATGLVLNPEDWETIEMAKGSDGHYLWISINDGGVQRLFRVPVVDTTAMAVGEFLTGAFGMGAQLRDREQAGIRIGEPNDFFLRGKKAVMAEERLALVTYRPEAFVKGKFAESAPI
jgi:HK97 family phage major capsid protein